MWQRHLALILLSINLVQVPAYAVETSSGPTSEKEAKILWEDGQAAFKKGHYQDAVNALQRYVARYPSQVGYLKAHRLLGESLFAIGKAEEAIEPLNYFVTNTTDVIEGIEAKILLGKAYLKQHKNLETLLTVTEIEKMKEKEKLTRELRFETQFVKAQALLALNEADRNTEIESALRSAEENFPKSASGSVKGSFHGLKLRYSLRNCAIYPTHESLTEGQIQDQMDRRGTCLLESLLILPELIKSKNQPSIEDAYSNLRRSFQDYAYASANPPAKNQNKAFKTELANDLIHKFREKMKTAQGLLSSWCSGNSEAKSSRFSEEQTRGLKEFTQSLKKIQPKT